ncbi:MAG: squalene synthase HpnC [Betaproteobacteria bacterium]|nr:squalene synthase HpnC [Betaproteobacteria bacterium]
MAVNHYENFPVASILVPARQRPAVEALYAFARSADDLADEGEATSAERLAALNDFRRGIDAIERGETPDDPIFGRLAGIVREYGLATSLLRDLLDAFAQDVVKTRYADFAELCDYSRRSAEPVGRLMLQIFAADTAQHRAWSDHICTSLQLINFWQDVAIDWRKGRVYLPLDECERFGVSEAQIGAGYVDARWRALMRFEVERAQTWMLAGAPLATALPGRFGWEIRLVVQGGLRILQAIEAAGYDVFQHRPRLGAIDWVRLAWRAALMK